VASKQSAASWTLQGPETGCKNWLTMALGPWTVGESVESCGQKCAETDECASFNVHNDGCEDDPFPFPDGACYLFKEGCVTHESACWAMYQMRPPTVMQVKLAFSMRVQTNLPQDIVQTNAKDACAIGMVAPKSRLEVLAAQPEDDADSSASEGYAQWQVTCMFDALDWDQGTQAQLNAASLSDNPQDMESNLRVAFNAHGLADNPAPDSVEVQP